MRDNSRDSTEKEKLMYSSVWEIILLNPILFKGRTGPIVDVIKDEVKCGKKRITHYIQDFNLKKSQRVRERVISRLSGQYYDLNLKRKITLKEDGLSNYMVNVGVTEALEPIVKILLLYQRPVLRSAKEWARWLENAKLWSSFSVDIYSKSKEFSEINGEEPNHIFPSRNRNDPRMDIFRTIKPFRDAQKSMYVYKDEEARSRCNLALGSTFLQDSYEKDTPYQLDLKSKKKGVVKRSAAWVVSLPLLETYDPLQIREEIKINTTRKSIKEAFKGPISETPQILQDLVLDPEVEIIEHSSGRAIVKVKFSYSKALVFDRLKITHLFSHCDKGAYFASIAKIKRGYDIGLSIQGPPFELEESILGQREGNAHELILNFLRTKDIRTRDIDKFMIKVPEIKNLEGHFRIATGEILCWDVTILKRLTKLIISVGACRGETRMEPLGTSVFLMNPFGRQKHLTSAQYNLELENFQNLKRAFDNARIERSNCIKEFHLYNHLLEKAILWRDPKTLYEMDHSKVHYIPKCIRYEPRYEYYDIF